MLPDEIVMRAQVTDILTCTVANTLHISKRAKATARTAPITLRITNRAFISDGQSKRKKIIVQLGPVV